jgi:ubiquitin thioesterase protein OTUB1
MTSTQPNDVITSDSKNDGVIIDAANNDADSNSNSNSNDVSISLSAQEQDAKTRAQMEAIGEEVRANQRLTSELLPILELANDFSANTDATNVGFRQGCAYLATQYTSYRGIRGDGNCYYRAFLFALVEHLCNKCTATDELSRIRDYVNRSIEDIVKCGYDRFTIDMFHEEMVELLAAIAKEREQQGKSSPSSISSSLYNRLNVENATSDYCVWYLRVITSAYLKSDPDRFVHFLDNPLYIDVATYCTKEIDPMGKECSMVGVLALAEAFGINVDIEYMDGRPLDGTNNNNKLVKHSFGNHDDKKSDNDSILRITLLYRPGHYDILYK